MQKKICIMVVGTLLLVTLVGCNWLKREVETPDGSIPESWKVLSGKWSVQEQNGEEVFVQNAPGGGLIVCTETAHGDCVITGRVKYSEPHYSKYAGLVFGSNGTDMYYRFDSGVKSKLFSPQNCSLKISYNNN